MKQYFIQKYKTVKAPIIIDDELEETEEEFTSIESDHGIESLKSVFVNGELKQIGQDYSVENNRVIFNDALGIGDKVKLVYNIETVNNLISPKANVNHSVLSKYNSDIRLCENNKYTVNICIDKENYTWQFNSKQTPLFSSAKKIYEDIGEFIEGFTEEYITNKIYDNSIAVLDLIDSLKEKEVENVSYTENSDGTYTLSSKAINNWVRFKTDIDLTLARYFGISYKYGTKIKEIGDIKIEKTTKLPYIDNLLDYLRSQFEEADQIIKGLNKVATAVKAGTRYKYDSWDRTTTW